MQTNEILKHLKEQNIKFVRVLFCDNANIIRSKAFHIDVLPEHFHTGVSITVAQQAFPTGEKPHGQFMGFGRLHFYSNDGDSFFL